MKRAKIRELLRELNRYYAFGGEYRDAVLDAADIVNRNCGNCRCRVGRICHNQGKPMNNKEVSTEWMCGDWNPPANWK